VHQPQTTIMSTAPTIITTETVEATVEPITTKNHKVKKTRKALSGLTRRDIGYMIREMLPPIRALYEHPNIPYIKYENDTHHWTVCARPEDMEQVFSLLTDAEKVCFGPVAKIPRSGSVDLVKFMLARLLNLTSTFPRDSTVWYERDAEIWIFRAASEKDLASIQQLFNKFKLKCEFELNRRGTINAKPVNSELAEANSVA
jgi:hypothetical protein